MFKKNPNEKTKVFDFYYTELFALAEYLEQQEASGYRLKSIRNEKLVFEKSQPRKIRYSAEIFKGTSAKEFVEACEVEGWEHVATYNNELYIFRTQRSDAINIMTDEKENFSIIAKRALLQPGLWGLICSAIYPLYHLILRLNGAVIRIFETDVLNYVLLMLTALYVFIALLRFFDFFLWQYKYRKDGAESPFFSLKSTTRKRKIYAVATSVFIIILCAILWWIYPPCFVWLWGIIIALLLLTLCYHRAILTKLTFDKSVRFRRIAVTCVILALLTAGAFILRGFNQKYVAENTKILFSSDEAPVSIEDLNGNVKDCADSCEVQGTRFGHLYQFICDAEFYEDDYDKSGYVAYNILVSDYPHVRQKYINKILKDYKEYDYDYVKISNPDTKWDYCYIVNWNDENQCDGFAVKDNMIIYLRLSVSCEKDFFDVAYEKLFNEEK